MKSLKALILALALVFCMESQALPAVKPAYSYSADSLIIGSSMTYTARKNESLIEIARKFDIGFNSISNSNPDLDPFVPGEGSKVMIPTVWILPDIAYDGIVINLSEMRLYYFFKFKDANLVRTFPIGIGSEGFDTPTGSYKIIQKTVNPSWHVPLSIQKERPGMPTVVPPGPENPLGTHALRLSRGDYLIHGTHRPYGVGRRVSHGCIRLYPEDIPKLFSMISIGTNVNIIRQPVKVSSNQNKIYVEVHADDQDGLNYFTEAVRLLRRKNLLNEVNIEKLYLAVKEKKGIPIEVSD